MNVPTFFVRVIFAPKRFLKYHRGIFTANPDGRDELHKCWRRLPVVSYVVQSECGSRAKNLRICGRN
jgi:hypothetical protein